MSSKDLLPYYGWIQLGMSALIISVLIPGISSLAGGWWRLSKDYAASGRPHGRCYWFQTAHFRHVLYGNMLRFHSGPDGVFISLWPSIVFFHPVLFIPWADLKSGQSLHRHKHHTTCTIAGVSPILLPTRVIDDRPDESTKIR